MCVCVCWDGIELFCKAEILVAFCSKPFENLFSSYPKYLTDTYADDR